MDEDTVFAIGFLIIIFLLPIIILASIFTISAAVTTRQWQKKKAQRFLNADVRDPLVAKKSPAADDSDSDSDLEVLDSEDEAERKDRREAKREEEAEWLLTTKEKFVKELMGSFNGKGRKEMERKRKEKERSDRRKLAKDVVKVMRRYERRQARLERRGESSAFEGGASEKQVRFL